MSIVGINNKRVSPVQEDLTKDYMDLVITRGFEAMARVDKKVVPQVELTSGEWAVLNADEECERPGATPVAATFLVLAGTDRYDSHGTQQLTLAMGATIQAKTNKYDKTPTYAVGDFLTVKDRGDGEADLTKAATGEIAHAMVVSKGADFIEFETLGRGTVAP